MSLSLNIRHIGKRFKQNLQPFIIFSVMYTLLCDKLLVGKSIKVLTVLQTKRLYQNHTKLNSFHSCQSTPMNEKV